MTTFVLPSAVFPTEIRTTFNGIAAACGKLGAIGGIWLFKVRRSSYHCSVTNEAGG